MERHRIWQAAVVLLVVGLAFAAVAQNFGVGRVRTITIVEKTRVGDALLPAGEYDVKHTMLGAEHVLIFTAVANSKISARANCKMVQLQQKADRNEQEYTHKSGERVLTGLVFKGDNFRHEL